MSKALFRKQPVNKAPSYADNANNFASLNVFNSNGPDAPTEGMLRAYSKSGTVYGIVDLLASQVSAVEWRLYCKTVDNRVRYSMSDTGSDQRVEVRQHQALKVLQNPNPFMTTMELMEISQTYFELTGESWWIIDYAGGIPNYIWPVSPVRMTVVPSKTSFIAGYIYNAPDGDKVPFKVNEVILHKKPNPNDIYRGSSPIKALMPDIDAGQYAAQYTRNFFLNDASPGGVIQTPNELSDEEFDQFANRWRETHRGVSRAHRVAILEQGMTWVNTHINQKDMDFVQLVKSSQDNIRMGYRIHPSLMGQVEDVNRANAMTATEDHVNTKIIPRCDRWANTLNNKYLPLFGAAGQNVEFDYVPPTPINKEAENAELEAKANSVQKLVDSGYEPHSVLEVVGLPDMDVAEKAAQTPALPPGWVPEPASPAAPANIKNAASSKVFTQMAEDYPASAMSWMHHAEWSGPVEVPVSHVDPTLSELSDADPDHVQDFVKRLQAGKKNKPVVMVKTPGSSKLQLVDGHHRFLASAELKQPVRAFIGTVSTSHGPWESMHDKQFDHPSAGKK